MFLSCIPRCRSPGPKKPCCGCLAQWWGRWASPHPRRTWRFKQKKTRVQDRLASPLAQHSRLGFASSPDNHQPTKIDDLRVVGERANTPTTPKLLYRALPWVRKPPQVPLSRLILVKAQIEPRGSANAHLTEVAVGPDDFACVSGEARSGPGLAPDPTAGAEQSHDLQATLLLEQRWPSNDERGTAMSLGAEQGSVEALTQESLGMVGLEPELCGAVEQGATQPPAAAKEVPSVSAPVPRLSFPTSVILYFSLLLPIVFLFSTFLSLYQNKI